MAIPSLRRTCASFGMGGRSGDLPIDTGRDLYSRLVHGNRTSLTIGLVGVALSLILRVVLGRIMETAPIEILFTRPAHPNTAALPDAIPRPDPRMRYRSRIRTAGEVPSPLNPQSGFPFHPRCAHAQDRCRNELPELESIAPVHRVRCHLWRELDLKGTD